MELGCLNMKRLSVGCPSPLYANLRCDTPRCRSSISAMLARDRMIARKNECDIPLCNTISKRPRVIGGISTSSLGPLHAELDFRKVSSPTELLTKMRLPHEGCHERVQFSGSGMPFKIVSLRPQKRSRLKPHQG